MEIWIETGGIRLAITIGNFLIEMLSPLFAGIVLISSMLSKELGGMDVSVLMGANLAWEIARGSFCETTIGYRRPESGRVIREIFDDPLFRVGMVPDIPGVEACGALKNVVALGAGFCDGLELGDNSKGAIIRIGLMEMKKFIQQHFPGVKDETFFQSCGVADLIVTCYGGRNRRCAEAFVRVSSIYPRAILIYLSLYLYLFQNMSLSLSLSLSLLLQSTHPQIPNICEEIYQFIHT
jgi:hypothetical protein